MNIYIALFRGINVGGHGRLPMKELVALLEDLGAQGIKTYIQSGNAVFRSAEKDRGRLADEISREIDKRRGFAPSVLVLEPADLDKAIAENPFPDAESDAGSLHLGFLSSVPRSPDFKKLESLRKTSERFRMVGKVFYLHAPEGVGRSKLAAGAEKALGVPLTDRNWRTVCTVRDMANGLRSN